MVYRVYRFRGNRFDRVHLMPLVIDAKDKDDALLTAKSRTHVPVRYRVCVAWDIAIADAWKGVKKTLGEWI